MGLRHLVPQSDDYCDTLQWIVREHTSIMPTRTPKSCSFECEGELVHAQNATAYCMGRGLGCHKRVRHRESICACMCMLYVCVYMGTFV